MRIARVTGTIRAVPGGDAVIVQVEADTGEVAQGEAYGGQGIAAATLAALDAMIAARCIGVELPAPELTESIRHALYGATADGPVAYALSGLDTALHDFPSPIEAGQDGGSRPSPRLAVRIDAADDVLHALASKPSAIVFYSDNPAAITRAAAQCAAARTPCAVQCTAPWPLHEAIAILRELEAAKLLWIADPVWPPENHAALRVLRERTRVPLAAGLYAASIADFERLLATRTIACARLDITRVGGPSIFRRLAATAARFGANVSARVCGPGPGLQATLAACAAVAPDALVEHPLPLPAR